MNHVWIMDLRGQILMNHVWIMDLRGQILMNPHQMGVSTPQIHGLGVKSPVLGPFLDPFGVHFGVPFTPKTLNTTLKGRIRDGRLELSLCRWVPLIVVPYIYLRARA